MPRCFSRFRLCAAFFAGIALAACGSPARPAHAKPAPPPRHQQTMTITAPALYTEHSYRGKPDLGLTLAIVAAGGGPAHFTSARLFRALAGPHAGAESRKLTRLYGKAKMAAFMQTFTFAVHDLALLFKMNDVALPGKPSIAPDKGRAIVGAIYHDGIMPTGKYDCGYMMEHLMTHPVHVVLMHDIDVAHGHGPRHNANFHIILTRMVVDLRNLYHA
jgi:hypothetical protein